jgi:O-antigen/teichoic acid export membrane protein
MADPLILSATRGPDAVAVYSIAQRVFSVTVVAELSFSSLWAAFGEALASGDLSWVRSTFTRSLKISLAIAGAICGALLVAGPTIFHLLTHALIMPSWTLMICFALWRLFNIVQGHLAILLNHEATLWRQTYWFLAASTLSFVLKVPLLRLFGTPGLIISTLLAFATLYAIPGCKLAKDLLTPIRDAKAAPVEAVLVEQ